jgi:hypothetical protein
VAAAATFCVDNARDKKLATAQMAERTPIKRRERFGRLVVIKQAPPRYTPNGRCIYRVLAKCDCGNKVIVYENKLRTGMTRSCSCYRTEKSTERLLGFNTKHGHTWKGGSSPTYLSWQGMVARCTNPSSPAWKWYGGRGIRVCRRWRSFENFLADMGERPHGLTLERRNNDGGYKPSNCCWATRSQQARNRRPRERDIYGRFQPGR